LNTSHANFQVTAIRTRNPANTKREGERETIPYGYNRLSDFSM